MDVGYKASDPGSKHYSGFFLFHFILHSNIKQVVLHVILLKETIWLQPMLPNAKHVDVPNQSCEIWTLLIFKRILLFQLIDIAAGYVTKTGLYPYRSFSLTWSATLWISCNKRKIVQYLQDPYGNQHGRRFIFFLHKYGRRDVVWKRSLVERRFNELLCNEILGITSDFLQPSNGEIYGKNLNVTKPWYSEHIVRVPLAIPQGILSVEIFQ